MKALRNRTDMDRVLKVKMDSRCPKQLRHHPDEWCSLAVIRLKALRNAGRELTEEEESNCPGCPWATSHQLSCYCFFKYAHDYLPDSSPSDIEIAYANSISIETVKKVEKKALEKIKESQMIKDIKESYGDSGVLDGVKEDTVEYPVLN